MSLARPPRNRWLRPAAAVVASLGTLACTNSAAAANYVVLGGRVVDVDVAPPFAPTDRAECEAFRDEHQRLLKELERAHDECLKGAATGGSGSAFSAGGSKVSTCSKPACQGLHTGRDDLREAINRGSRQCLEAVAEADAARRSTGRANAAIGSGDAREPDHASFGEALRRVAAGPAAGVRRLVRQQVGRVIDHVFGPAAPIVRGALDAGAGGTMLWDHTHRIRGQCSRTGRGTVARECDRELIDTFESLSQRVPVRLRTDPAIGLIQQAMLARLAVAMREVSHQLDTLERDIDRITTDPEPRPTPAARTRRRAVPLIEN
jgi:hypothetical protein